LKADGGGWIGAVPTGYYIEGVSAASVYKRYAGGRGVYNIHTRADIIVDGANATVA